MPTEPTAAEGRMSLWQFANASTERGRGPQILRTMERHGVWYTLRTLWRLWRDYRKDSDD